MKIGDKVSVIDENLDGIITSVHGKMVVFIDDFGIQRKSWFPEILIFMKI